MGKPPKIQDVARDMANKTAISDARGQTDTIKLWENYRDQAQLWRAVALFQMPATLILVIFSTVLWVTRVTYLKVPARPLPGQYVAGEIPDAEFVAEATNFINLIATYQPYVARRQFTQAREMLEGNVLQMFDSDMMDIELRAIETTNRTQLYFIDPTKTTVERPANHQVIVTFVGERAKYVAGKELQPVFTKFTITLTTIPRQRLNPYGIVITNVVYENVERK